MAFVLLEVMSYEVQFENALSLFILVWSQTCVTLLHVFHCRKMFAETKSRHAFFRGSLRNLLVQLSNLH